jgi:hypothetical protein
MAIPEWVPSNEHHKPSDIQKLSEKLPEVQFIITHTFIDSNNSQMPKITSKEFPSHPRNVLHAEDGFSIKWENKWIF